MLSLTTTSGKMLAMGTILHLGNYTGSSCPWQCGRELPERGSCIWGVWGAWQRGRHQAHVVQWDTMISCCVTQKWSSIKGRGHENKSIFRATLSHLNPTQQNLCSTVSTRLIKRQIVNILGFGDHIYCWNQSTLLL